MYFQNYFADRSIKLESFTRHSQHSRSYCISYLTLAFGSSFVYAVYIISKILYCLSPTRIPNTTYVRNMSF